MSATRFKSLALYPGGQGGCGIVFSDPNIPETNTLRKVSLPFSTVQPLIWNMKEWQVSVYASSVSLVQQEPNAPDFNYDLAMELTGKFYGFNGSFEQYFGDAYRNQYIAMASTNAEPMQKICGRYNLWEYQELGEFPEEPIIEESSIVSRSILLPVVSFDLVTDTTESGLFSNSSSDGDFEFNHIRGTAAFSRFSIVLNPYRIWVKDDGSCDVYFYCVFRSSKDFYHFLSNENTSGELVGQVAGSFLGASFSLPVYSEYGENLGGGEDISFVSASLTYDIDVTEAWPYIVSN